MVTNFSKKQKSDKEKDYVFLKICAIIFVAIAILLIFANIKLYQKRKELVS
jgi:cell division protein FtsL